MMSRKIVFSIACILLLAAAFVPAFSDSWRLPPRVSSSSDARTATESSNFPPGKPICSTSEESFDSSDVARISSEEFYAKAKERPLPPYPAIAKAARAEGTIVVEVLVSMAGDVICARTLSGTPC